MAQFLQIRVQVLSKPGVSRYKLSRSQKTVTVQFIYCRQMCALAAVASAKAGVRMQVLAGFVMGAGCRKNNDNCVSRTFSAG